MIIRRWDGRTYGGRVKVYPRALSEDWFFFFSVLWCLAAKAFKGGRNCNRLPYFSFFLPFSLQEGILYYISPSHWSWLSICWSHRSLLECLSHPPPSSTCCKLQQIRWYHSGVISSLMRPDCQLRAFNVEMTASPRIAFLPCSYGWPIGSELPLGCSRGLPLATWRFPLPWFWSAKDRVVLDSISWQSGFPLFVIGHFFLLGMGLGLDMKWARVPRSFGPTGFNLCDYD